MNLRVSKYTTPNLKKRKVLLSYDKLKKGIPEQKFHSCKNKSKSNNKTTYFQQYVSPVNTKVLRKEWERKITLKQMQIATR